MTKKNDVLENFYRSGTSFLIAYYICYFFDDLSIITRLAASSSVLSNCLGSKGIPLRSQAFSNK